jgi:hypothetical protein
LEDRLVEFTEILMEQDDIIKRWEKVHLPTPEEAIKRMNDRERNGQHWCYSHEESYILIWGPEKFERIWKKSAEPYLKSLGLK